jgi:hypothetical protein
MLEYLEKKLEKKQTKELRKLFEIREQNIREIDQIEHENALYILENLLDEINEKKAKEAELQLQIEADKLKKLEQIENKKKELFDSALVNFEKLYEGYKEKKQTSALKLQREQDNIKQMELEEKELKEKELKATHQQELTKLHDMLKEIATLNNRQ